MSDKRTPYSRAVEVTEGMDGNGMMLPLGMSMDGGGGSDFDKRSRAQREKPSRTLFVRNISYDIAEEVIRKEFGKYGEIKKIFNLIEKRGMAFITYFDLRHADVAKRELQDSELGGRRIDVHYSLPKEDPKEEDDKNKGTLFVTVRDATEEVDNVGLKKLFEKWGQIKEVRDCTGSPNQKFVECWDLRDAEKIVLEKQDMAFAGGRLDIKYAYHSTPRDKYEIKGRNARERSGGPIRTSYTQRQSNYNADSFNNRFGMGIGMGGIGAMDTMSALGAMGAMSGMGLVNPMIGGLAGTGNILHANQQLTLAALSGQNPQNQPSPAVQQAVLTYLWSLQKFNQQGQYSQGPTGNNTPVRGSSGGGNFSPY